MAILSARVKIESELADSFGSLSLGDPGVTLPMVSVAHSFDSSLCSCLAGRLR